MGTGTGPGGSRGGVAPAEGAPFVAVPALRDFLKGVPDRPASVLVGPPGSGKSTHAAAWTRERPDLDVHWLHAGRAGAGTPRRARVLVVHDAHLLAPRISDALAERLLAPADPLRLLLLTRQEVPRLPASLVLAGDVDVRRFPDLRLGTDTARAVVRAHCPGATPAQVEQVVDLSDGWAGALVVGARSLSPGAPAPSPVVPAALDGLLAEVVDGAPEQLRRVLTSVADQETVDADLAVVLSGNPAAGRLLDDAAADGLLVRRLPAMDRGPSWRLHPLLVRLLHRRAVADRSAAQLVSDAHARAAHHHARHGDAEAAVRHAARSGDLRLQVEMLRSFAPDLVSRGEVTLVEDVLDHLPDGLRDASPELVTLDALVLRALRRYDAAKRAADRALATPPGRTATSPDLAAELALLDVWQARCGWRPRRAAMERAAVVLGCHHLPGRGDGTDAVHGHDTSGISPLRSAWLMLDLADLELWTDGVASAVEHLQAVDAFAQEAGVTSLRAGVLAHRAVAEMVRGAYQTSAATAEECLLLQQRAGHAPGLITARCRLVRGWARFHALDHAGARSDLAAAALEPQPFDPVAVTYRRLLEVNLLLAGGELDRARQALDGEGALPGPLPRHARRHVGFARFRVAGYAGDLAAMVAEARAFRRTRYDADADLAEALVRGLSGAESAAVSDLDALVAHTDLEERTSSELPRVTAASAAVARAALLHRLGTPDAVARAAELVPDVLARVAPQRLWWLLANGVMISPRFVDLVAAEADRADAHPAAGEALAVLRQRPRPYPARTASFPATRDPAATGLTSRELDVLRVLGAGGSNHDIARQLFVTENTVKTHLAAVYRKLGVPGRDEAAREARRLGLLG